MSQFFVITAFGFLTLIQLMHSAEPENKRSLMQRRPGRIFTEDTTPVITNNEKIADSPRIDSSRKQYSRRQTFDTISTKPATPTPYSAEATKDKQHKENNILKFSLPKISPRHKTNSLTHAVQHYDLDATQLYIDNPNANLNQKDQWGNTALHCGMAQLTELINKEKTVQKIIALFLCDPRTDTSITRDGDNRTACQILSGGECPEVRALLFARATLDVQTNHAIGKMLLESYINNIAINDNLIERTVQSIKDKIQEIETVQKDNNRDLPEEAKLPGYATDDFIFTMIKNRIPAESQNISESQKKALRKIFFQKIEIIPSNVSMDIDEEPIKESIENILTTIDKSYNHLMRFMTKPCIFELFKTYAEQQITPLNCITGLTQ
jgi:hypothetical protein